MGKSLLLISQRPDDQEFAAEVAIAAGLSLVTAADPREGAKILAQEKLLAVLVDASSQQQYQEFEDAVQETVGLFSDQLNANYLHYISSEDLSRVQFLLKSPIFGHFVFRNFANTKQAGQHYGRLVKATTQERAFGLQNIFGTKVKVQTVNFDNTGQKQEAVEAVKNYLLAAKFKARMASIVANAVDELLMNAMFDAPMDELGKQRHASESRATVRKLSGRDAVGMSVAFDGDYVAVSAIDHYGSLDKAKLMNHISKLYTEEEYKVKTTVAGAGLGLATVFRSGGSFFFISESNTMTEAIVFFRRTDSFRDFKDQFRFVSTQFYF
ncbi:MAG: hypothetical protein IT285_14835 [Bdellovibrionales bacterium]|nr:hypothetical protein [Bdellovibrionales bacterium]